MARLSLSLLGPFDTRLDGEPVVFPTDKARALLAYLAVEADHPQRRDTLAGLLWPDQPQRKARQNLRQALAYVHKSLTALDADDDSLDQPVLFVTRETMQFNRESDHVARYRALQHALRSVQRSSPPSIGRVSSVLATSRSDGGALSRGVFGAVFPRR